MMESLVPPGIIVVKADATWMWQGGLLPEESVAIGPRTVEKRSREFIAGRNCARQALTALGLPNASIPVGSHGQPLWPPGIVGSITHCSGYCAVAVGRKEQFTTVGIDAQPHAPLPPDVEEFVCTEKERHWMQSALKEQHIHWATVIFSAKESLYKAWFPLTHQWLGFDEAELAIDPQQSTFTAKVLLPPHKVVGLRLTHFAGRFVVADGYIFTAIVVAREWSLRSLSMIAI